MQAEFLDLKTQASVFKQGMTLIEERGLCKVAALMYFEAMHNALDRMLQDLVLPEAQANHRDGET